MNLQSYKVQRESLQSHAPQYRSLCAKCCKPENSCYCSHIQKFDPKIKFAILIHPIEKKRTVATGRMSHLCMENSELIVGQDYSENSKVNALLENKSYQPLVLYPGVQSLNLTHSSEQEKSKLFPANKIPLIFVIDGTWATARKMMRQSQNLKDLPRICFTPPGPSQFRVRKQPKAECYSTIEAIHHCIDLLGNQLQLNLQQRPHDNLIAVFNKMVERQLDCIRDAFDNPRTTSYRKPKVRVA